MNPKRLTTRFCLARVSRIGLNLLVCVGLIMSAQVALAQAPSSKEYKVKVAYLYKIALYVNHGSNTGLTEGSELVIGVLGPDPFGSYLDQIAAKRKIHNRNIVVKRFASWAEYQACDLLFVSNKVDRQSVASALAASQTKSVLLVGEEEGFERQGGIFNMYLDGTGKVGIKLNIDAANRNQFRVDARLLQVCDVVRDSQPSE